MSSGLLHVGGLLSRCAVALNYGRRSLGNYGLTTIKVFKNGEYVHQSFILHDTESDQNCRKNNPRYESSRSFRNGFFTHTVSMVIFVLPAILENTLIINGPDAMGQ